VRFLSDASYTIYLYHTLFITLLSPLLPPLPTPLRAVILTSAGLFGGITVVYMARRALGDRARLLFGT
jgi:peptidoglycan/LPS O-acetylase OafA/YrhL